MANHNSTYHRHQNPKTFTDLINLNFIYLGLLGFQKVFKCIIIITTASM
uniref:Uncharacterized protein n=1 Tax=Schistosoma curassoni TaxID=6186 RepID=A0A183KNV1_9TREM